MIYYNKDKIVVRTSILEDVQNLKCNLRKSDIEEIWASHRRYPEEALRCGLIEAIECLTVLVEDQPVAMFGITCNNLLDSKACIWLLSSEKIDKIRFRFAKYSRHFIDLMLDLYPYLENYVDVRNRVSIEWLKFCGAKVDAPAPYGIDQIPFQHFYFERH